MSDCDFIFALESTHSPLICLSDSAASWYSQCLLFFSRGSTACGSALLCLILSVSAFAKKEFVRPEVHPANTYPAKDSHPEEKVTIAVDPYDKPDKASIFRVHYGEEGFSSHMARHH